MQETIGLSCSTHSWDGRLIWNVLQKDVQVILEHKDVSMFTIPQTFWQQVEQLCPLYSKGTSPGIPHRSWSRLENLGWFNFSPCPARSGSEWYRIPRHQSLGDLPQEYYHIPLSSALLAVEMEDFQLSPIV